MDRYESFDTVQQQAGETAVVLTRKPSRARLKLMAFGLAGAALFSAGAVGVMAASSDPSATPDPVATQPADEGSTDSGSDTNQGNRRDCPKDAATDSDTSSDASSE